MLHPPLTIVFYFLLIYNLSITFSITASPKNFNPVTKCTFKIYQPSNNWKNVNFDILNIVQNNNLAFFKAASFFVFAQSINHTKITDNSFTKIQDPQLRSDFCVVNYFIKGFSTTMDLPSNKFFTCLNSDRDTWRSYNGIYWILVISERKFFSRIINSEIRTKNIKIFYMIVKKDELFDSSTLFRVCTENNELIEIRGPMDLLHRNNDMVSIKNDKVSLYFGYDVEPKLDHCAEYIYTKNILCYLRERVMANLCRQLNMTCVLVKALNSTIDESAISPSTTKFSYDYGDIGKIYNYYFDGLELLHCIYDSKRVESVSFMAWLVPFKATAWITLLALLLLLGVVTLVQVT